MSFDRFHSKADRIYVKGIRNIIQICFLGLTIGIGIQFFIYVLQVSSGGVITVERSPGVEAFLPIGALMGWKLLLTELKWDVIHPAAMVILGFAVLLSLLFRKAFCGWICPVGTISEWLWKMGKKLFKKNYQLPRILDYVLRSLKYIILGLFLYVILSMSSEAIESFLESPYYKMSDAKMLFFFTRMSLTTLMVLSCLFIGSLFIKNFWCRYLCPYGALLGLFSLISPTKIERNDQSCIDCKKCSRNCPYNLPVDIKQKMRSSECNGCMECVNSCPVENTLQMKSLKKEITAPGMAVIVILSFVFIIYLAQITDHWAGSVSDQEFGMRLRLIDSPGYTHPGSEMMNRK